MRVTSPSQRPRQWATMAMTACPKFREYMDSSAYYRGVLGISMDLSFLIVLIYEIVELSLLGQHVTQVMEKCSPSSAGTLGIQLHLKPKVLAGQGFIGFMFSFFSQCAQASKYLKIPGGNQTSRTCHLFHQLAAPSRHFDLWLTSKNISQATQDP